LHAPREAAACRQAIVTALNEADQLRWDELDLRDMSVASPLVGLGAQFTGSRARVRCGPTESCPLSNLVGGFEAYLRRLSQGARGEARKLLREVERSGMKFEIAADAHAAGAFFDQMIVLHRDRWAMAGKSGSFAPRHAQFHRTLAKQLAPHGEVVLARLCLGDEPFAVTYGHRVHATYHCYQRGVSRLTEPVRSPGTALLLLLMARLAEGGVTRYEHLKGSNPFKERFATEHAEVTHLRVTRSNLRSLSTSASDWIARGLRKGLRAMRRR
jgi:CelD/BcsL family acetyltransferase involved in cellulose biosynthesis